MFDEDEEEIEGGSVRRLQGRRRKGNVTLGLERGYLGFGPKKITIKLPLLVSPLYEVNPNFLLNLHISYFIQIQILNINLNKFPIHEINISYFLLNIFYIFYICIIFFLFPIKYFLYIHYIYIYI